MKAALEEREAELAGMEARFQEAWIKKEAELQEALSSRETQWLKSQRDVLQHERLEWEKVKDRQFEDRRRELEASFEERHRALEESLRTRQKDIEASHIQREKEQALARHESLAKAKAELEASYRERLESLEIVMAEREKKLTTEFLAREDALNRQKKELADQELASLRAGFARKEAALEERLRNSDAEAARRKSTQEAEAERLRLRHESEIAAEREALRAEHDKRFKELEDSYREKFGLLEQEKSRATHILLEKEDALLAQYQKLERDLRNEMNLTKIELAAQHDEKMRKMAEDRVAMQKDYEHKLRELESRRERGHPDGPKTSD